MKQSDILLLFSKKYNLKRANKEDYTREIAGHANLLNLSSMNGLWWNSGLKSDLYDLKIKCSE